MKKVLAFLLVAAMATASLSGCQGKKSPSSSTSSGASASSTASSESVSGKLSFLSWYTQKQMQPLLDAYTKEYPNVTFDFQNVPNENSQYAQKLTLLANSGELPDLFYIQPPVNLMAKNGYLADISNLDSVKALTTSFKQAYTVSGKIYAYAPDCWVGGVFYNKDIFKKYNLSTPTTFSDFLNICKTLKANNVEPLSMAGAELPDLLYWIYMNETLPKDPAFDNELNTGKTFAEGYSQPMNDWYNEFVKTGYVTQAMAGMSDDQRMQDFATGKAAMTISGPWAISTFEQANPNLDFAIFPYVSNSPGNNYDIGAVNPGIAISSKANNSAAAKAFLNFLGTSDSLKIYQKITGNFLGISGVDYTIDSHMDPVKSYALSGKFSYPSVSWINGGTLGTVLDKGMQNIILGTTTPDKLIKDLDSQNKDLLAANS